MSQPDRPLLDPETERADRAARVAAMLDRWAAEAAAEEPDWDVESLERLDLTRHLGKDEPTAPPEP